MLLALGCCLVPNLWGQMPGRCAQTYLHIHLVYEGTDMPVRGRMQVQLMGGFGNGDTARTQDGDGRVDFTVASRASYRVRVSTDNSGDITSSEFMVGCNERDHDETIRIPRPQSQLAPNGEQTISAAELVIPDKARKEFEKASQAFRKDDFENARKHFEKALEIYPKYALAENDLGVIFMKTGERELGRAAFEKAMALDPHQAQPYLNLGRFALNDKQPERAEQLLTTVVRLDPRNAEAFLLLAVAQLELGKLREAVESAHRVHLLGDDKLASAHMMAARALRAYGHYEEAAAEYEAYLRETPAGPLSENARRELAEVNALNAPLPPPERPPTPPPQ